MRRIGQTAVTVAMVAALGGCARQAAQTRREAARPPTSVAVNMRRQILNAADAGEGDPVANQLRRRIAAEPAEAAPRLELASHYGRNGFPELELEHLRLAVERFPALAAARVALARALRSQGLTPQAVETLTALTDLDRDAEALNLLGICYDELGEWKAGEQAFRRALAAAPRLDHLRNNLGYNLLEQQRVAEAVVQLEQAVALNPRSATARNNLGLALARTPGRGLADALSHFENTTDAATAHSNLAAALIEQSRLEESRRLLESAINFNRSHAPALANLKLLAELDGKPAELRLRPSRNPWLWPLWALKWLFVDDRDQGPGTGDQDKVVLKSKGDHR